MFGTGLDKMEGGVFNHTVNSVNPLINYAIKSYQIYTGNMTITRKWSKMTMHRKFLVPTL